MREKGWREGGGEGEGLEGGKGVREKGWREGGGVKEKGWRE